LSPLFIYIFIFYFVIYLFISLFILSGQTLDALLLELTAFSWSLVKNPDFKKKKWFEDGKNYPCEERKTCSLLLKNQTVLVKLWNIFLNKTTPGNSHAPPYREEGLDLFTMGNQIDIYIYILYIWWTTILLGKKLLRSQLFCFFFSFSPFQFLD